MLAAMRQEETNKVLARLEALSARQLITALKRLPDQNVPLGNLVLSMIASAENPTCPYCLIPVTDASDKGRYVNGIRPKNASDDGCEFCNPTPYILYSHFNREGKKVLVSIPD